LAQAGDRKSAAVRFETAVSLQSQVDYWIVVKASRGRAVWLSRDDSGARLLMVSKEPGSGRSATPVALSKKALCWLFPEAASDADLPAYAVFVGKIRIAGTADAEGRRCYDLRAALVAYLGEQPTGAKIVDAPLDFVAASRGLVTLYPAHVVEG